MTGPDHGDQPIARRLADLLGQVEIALVDQHALDARHRLAELVEEPRQRVALAEVPQVVLAELLLLEHPGDQRRDQHQLLPERERAPGPTQGDADLAVAEVHGDAAFLRSPRRLEQFRARSHTQLQAQRALIGRHHEVQRQGGELLVADDLAQVEPVEALRLGERLVAPLVEFDADGVAVRLVDDLAHQVGRLLRDMGRPDQDELPAVDECRVDVRRRQGKGRGFGIDERLPRRPARPRDGSEPRRLPDSRPPDPRRQPPARGRPRALEREPPGGQPSVMPLPFAKLQAAGNAYLAVDGRGCARDWPGLARAMASPHTGIGSDGLVVVCASEHAPVRMRVFNSDGSEAEMSGNGLRLFTKFVLDRGLAECSDGALRVETGGGVRTVWPGFEAGRMSHARIAMGVPTLTHDGTRTVLDVGGRALPVTTLSIGNPHAVHLVETPVAGFPLDVVGPEVERHAAFPNRTNFEVVQVLDRGRIAVRVFERGEGETLSSGTGSTASAIAARLAGLTAAAVEVVLPGGTLEVAFEGAGHEAWLAGPTVEVFEGEWPLD